MNRVQRPTPTWRRVGSGGRGARACPARASRPGPRVSRREGILGRRPFRPPARARPPARPGRAVQRVAERPRPQLAGIEQSAHGPVVRAAPARSANRRETSAGWRSHRRFRRAARPAAVPRRRVPVRAVFGPSRSLPDDHVRSAPRWIGGRPRSAPVRSAPDRAPAGPVSTKPVAKRENPVISSSPCGSRFSASASGKVIALGVAPLSKQAAARCALATLHGTIGSARRRARAAPAPRRRAPLPTAARAARPQPRRCRGDRSRPDRHGRAGTSFRRPWSSAHRPRAAVRRPSPRGSRSALRRRRRRSAPGHHAPGRASDWGRPHSPCRRRLETPARRGVRSDGGERALGEGRFVDRLGQRDLVEAERPLPRTVEPGPPHTPAMQRLDEPRRAELIERRRHGAGPRRRGCRSRGSAPRPG